MILINIKYYYLKKQKEKVTNIKNEEQKIQY